MGEERHSGREPRSDAVRVVYSIQGGGATSTVNGSNVFVNEDVCFTINTVDVHAVCYGISPYNSNAMMSSNPHSGIYVAETARTLDLNGGNPACNQGGGAGT